MSGRERRRLKKKKQRQFRVKQKSSRRSERAGKASPPPIELLIPTGFGIPNLTAERSLWLVGLVLERQPLKTLEEQQKYLDGLLGKSPEELARLADVTRDARTHAQHLAYEAYLAEGDEEADRLISDALALDAECVDALVYRTMSTALESNDPQQFVLNLQALPERLRDIIEIAERRLGPEYFEEWRGEFWNLPSRPYMRALRQYGRVLDDLGRLDEARPVFEKMLGLNPNDNQGVRDSLLCLYLEKKDLPGARRLFDSYSNECSAVFSFGRVLERLLSNDRPSARRLLKVARGENPFVEECLLDPELLPTDTPAFYQPGDFDEAVYCATIQLDAWEALPEALDWLIEQDIV